MNSEVLHRWVVAQDGLEGEVSLCALSVYEDPGLMNGSRMLELTDLWVEPKARGRGWGVELLRAACAWADDNHADLFIRVVAYGRERPRAEVVDLMKFYSRAGFVSRRSDQREMVRKWRLRKTLSKGSSKKQLDDGASLASS